MPKLRRTMLTAMLAAAVVPVFAGDAPSRPRGLLTIPDARDVVHRLEPTIRDRMDRSRAELEALHNGDDTAPGWAREWAGAYKSGDTSQILLTPDTGITFRRTDCFGMPSADFGDIASIEPDGLRIEPRFGTPGNSYLSERVYFVRWDEHRYLAQDWQLIEFVNSYNRGGWARGITGVPHLIRETPEPVSDRGEIGPVTSKPGLPSEYLPLLFDSKIPLKVVSVSDYAVTEPMENRKHETCTIVFDRGTEANLREGMTFIYRQDFKAGSHGEIEITFADSGIATAMLLVSSWKGKPTEIPSMGDTILIGPEPVDPSPR